MDNELNSPARNSELASVGIPARYFGADIDSFENGLLRTSGLKNNTTLQYLKRYMEERPLKDLYIFGVVGSGKTHLAVSVVQYLYNNGYLHDKTTRQFLKQRISFISVSQLCLSLRSAITRNIPEDEILTPFSNSGLLILDGLESAHLTDYAVSSIYSLIDRRYSDARPTITTSNMTLEDVETHLSQPIARRFGSAHVVHCNYEKYKEVPLAGN